MPSYNVHSILAGICPDCGREMKQWTEGEIVVEMADAGIAAGDNFFECCDPCSLKYCPASFQGAPK